MTPFTVADMKLIDGLMRIGQSSPPKKVSYRAEMKCGHQFLNEYEVSPEDVVFCRRCDTYRMVKSVGSDYNKSRARLRLPCANGHPASERVSTVNSGGKHKTYCRICNLEHAKRARTRKSRTPEEESVLLEKRKEAGRKGGAITREKFRKLRENLEEM